MVDGYHIKREPKEELSLRVIKKDKSLGHPSLKDFPHTISRLYPHSHTFFLQYT